MVASAPASVVRLTRAQVREVDRRAAERFLIPGVVLMENAARGAADVAWEMVGGTRGALVHVVCGGGNNGGDGLAIARHLHNRGADVSVVLAVEGNTYRDEALANWRIYRAMQLECLPARNARDLLARSGASLVVDALFGTGLTEPPRLEAAMLIDWVNAAKRPVLAVDLPSGLDCDTGKPLGPSCVKATKTVTFVAPKAGFANPDSKQYTGEVVVADIGCPPEVVEQVMRELP